MNTYRDRFHIPKTPSGADCVYLCGHSLGLQPKTVRAYLEQELKDWELLGVEAHFRARHPWMPYHRLVTEQAARLVGALPVEVVMMNSLTVNLHLMMVSFYHPTPQRYKIVMEQHAFPSDQYAVKSQINFHGFDPAESIVTVATEADLEAVLDESVALVLLGGVNYSTGRAFDLAEVTRMGHAKGCLVGFDLAHAAGNLAVKLHDSNADFAVWCSYKYLNAGPGNLGGCFVHQRHACEELPRFAGWWGHDQETRFRMGPDFHPMPGAEGWQLSNPAILPLAALRASLDIFDEAGIDPLRAASIVLTGHLQSLLDQHQDRGFTIVTPRDPARRGAQLSIRVERRPVREVCESLAEQGVLCDWREPDILRVTPVPLYNTSDDVEQFAHHFVRTCCP